MTFAELLTKKQTAIVQQWLDEALASYAKDAAELFKKATDRFANPVGNSLREGTQGIFAALLQGAEAEEIRELLREIVQIRAVQQFSPSQAIGFIFALKDVVRKELGDTARQPQYLDELAKFEGQIDQIALVAFDLLVEYRTRVFDLRMGEMKRNVSWVLGKMGQRVVDGDLVELE